MCTGKCSKHAGRFGKPEYKAIKEDQNGVGLVKIQGDPTPFIKNGKKIIVKIPLMSADGEAIGIAEHHDGDEYRCKLGVKIAAAKALKSFIVKERALHEASLGSVITKYDSLVEEIKMAMPDTTLKRIRARKPAMVTE